MTTLPFFLFIHVTSVNSTTGTTTSTTVSKMAANMAVNLTAKTDFINIFGYNNVIVVNKLSKPVFLGLRVWSQYWEQLGSKKMSEDVSSRYACSLRAGVC